MHEPDNSQSKKDKSTKIESTKTPKASKKVGVNKEISIGEQDSMPTKTKSTKIESTHTPKAPIQAVTTWIFSHWQFMLTFFVACAGTCLLINQNNLLQNQNTLIQRQMSLEEASRRSSLVMLMSNIMDKVDKEIENQQKGLSEIELDKKRYKLSQSLIGQIVALSHSFKPYRYMSGDTLISRRSSPERGQLLITLTLLPLDTSTLYKIYESATFQEADLNVAKLVGADLRGVDLRGADLSGARLDNANLSEANMNWADLSGAILDFANLDSAELHRADLSEVLLNGAHLVKTNLSMADLSKASCIGAQLVGTNFYGADLTETGLPGANLLRAVFIEADLTGVEFDLDQINKVFSLYKCRGMDNSIKEKLVKINPQLFNDPFR